LCKKYAIDESSRTNVSIACEERLFYRLLKREEKGKEPAAKKQQSNGIVH
jgi:hypothetical protein